MKGNDYVAQDDTLFYDKAFDLGFGIYHWHHLVHLSGRVYGINYFGQHLSIVKMFFLHTFGYTNILSVGREIGMS